MNQMRGIVKSIQFNGPVIVGGDFNVPQGDGVFSLLRPGLRDTFRAEGRGLGNTIPQEFPLVRIDQIWVSGDFEILQSFCRRSKISDHRPVITDVRVRGK
jgi:endonuclease/exonuclease/phosphatase (EEP) superfamily protein YafD